MYQFITGIAFELTLIIVFTIGYLMIDGKIKVRGTTSEDFAKWRMQNGRVIKFICLLTIFILLCSIIAKYIQWHSHFANPLPD